MPVILGDITHALLHHFKGKNLPETPLRFYFQIRK